MRLSKARTLFRSIERGSGTGEDPLIFAIADAKSARFRIPSRTGHCPTPPLWISRFAATVSLAVIRIRSERGGLEDLPRVATIDIMGRWNEMSVWAAIILAGSTLLGCGGDDEGPEEEDEGTCFVEVSVTGAVDFEQTHRDLFCLYSTSYETGISVTFIPYDEPLDSITLDVDEIMIDQVGTFPATLTFNHQDDRTFQSEDCEVTVEVHEPDGEEAEFGVSYRIRGSGSCSEPAASLDDPSETLTVSEFEFAAGVIWGDSVGAPCGVADCLFLGAWFGCPPGERTDKVSRGLLDRETATRVRRRGRRSGRLVSRARLADRERRFDGSRWHPG